MRDVISIGVKIFIRIQVFNSKFRLESTLHSAYNYLLPEIAFNLRPKIISLLFLFFWSHIFIRFKELLAINYRLHPDILVLSIFEFADYWLPAANGLSNSLLAFVYRLSCFFFPVILTATLTIAVTVNGRTLAIILLLIIVQANFIISWIDIRIWSNFWFLGSAIRGWFRSVLRTVLKIYYSTLEI